MDLVEIARIEAALRRPGFKERILTPREILQNLTPARIAGRWAAKEAVAKAVSTHLTWHDVEIFNGPDGAPMVEFARVFRLANSQRVHLSITHDRRFAAATAILEAMQSPDTRP
jgi:holo-[acyl-carrier protein] synthase